MYPDKEQTPDLAHNALLNLERSNSDSSIQLEEAARILGARYAVQQNGNLPPREQLSAAGPNVHAPRHDWVLRWLAKRIRADRDKR